MEPMRKQPRQQRSRAMVERIVTAARDLLAVEGYDAFSTNRVAARADVSPGSLYQYFPDKAALLDVLAQRWLDRVSEEVAEALLARLGQDAPDATVRAVASALLTALEADVEMLRIVWHELPAARHLASRTALEKRVRDALTAYLAVTLPAAERPRAARVAWMVVMSAEFLTVRFVLGDAPMGREEFLDELVALSSGLVPEVSG